MKKRLLTSLLSVSIAISILSSDTVIDTFAESTFALKSAELCYIENVLPDYLSAHDITSNNIYISQSYNVYNANLKSNASANTYIVFEDNDIIGLLNVDENNGNYYSSFEYNDFSAIQELYNESESIAFVAYDENLFVESEFEVYSVEDCDINADLGVVNTTFSNISRNMYINNSLYNNNSPSYYYRKNISVPIVLNDVCPLGHGLCWAATVASKYDYITGENISTIDLYNILDELYDDHPIGYPIWDERACDYLNMSYTYVGNMMNCADIYNNIRVNNPIGISLSRTGGAHAVLLCGITFLNDESGIYRIMDPNKTTYVDIAVSEDTMNGDEQLTYVTSYGYTYDNWFRSFY